MVCGEGEQPNGTECEPCPIGTYQDEYFQKRCKNCPFGESTTNNGSTNSDFCVPINPASSTGSSDSGESTSVCPSTLDAVLAAATAVSKGSAGHMRTWMSDWIIVLN